MKDTRLRHLVTVATLLCFTILYDSSNSAADSSDALGIAARARDLTVAMDFDGARAELARGDGAHPAVALAKARLALYEEQCDLAVTLTDRADVTRLGEEARMIADVARGCARVTAATFVDGDAGSDVVVRFQTDDDRVLAPVLRETAALAKQSLSADLAVVWKRPLRITVVRDLLSLSAMTGLPYSAAQTTGTVAVAKWGRVTILSPRANEHGYPFRDTLVHEMAHLAMAMQSLDRAPLWLHEGVARRQEARWRTPMEFDDRPDPDSVVQRGIELKLDLPLDQLGPSLAMLPTAQASTVAFAEVTSFVRFLVEKSPPAMLGQLLVALSKAPTVDEALTRVTHASFTQWNAAWKAHIAARPKQALSPMYGLGGALPGLRDGRDRTRLGELLFGRDHAREALGELDRIPSHLLSDSAVRYVRARALEASNRAEEARGFVDKLHEALSSYGPCWAIRGRLAVMAGNEQVAAASFEQARAHDPLGIESACEIDPRRVSELPPLADSTGAVSPGAAGTAADASGGMRVYRSEVCAAARERAHPDVGHD